MNIIECNQGTPEWLKCRAGIPTASELSVLVTSKGNISEGQGVRSFLMRKLAERWLGRPLESFHAFGAVDQGKVLEDEAIPFFEMERGIAVERVGFITTDDGKAGCSPDGLMRETKRGLELKCPEPQTHLSYLLAGELPDDYLGQVQGSLLVTGYEAWFFMSYCRHFPALILEVKPDLAYMATLAQALERFNEALDSAYLRLAEMNGGEPNREAFVDTDTVATMAGVSEDALEEFYDE